MKRQCKLCNATLAVSGSKKSSSCTSSYVRVVEHELCWMEQTSHIKKMCVQSAAQLRIRGEQRKHAISLFAQLGAAVDGGDENIEAFLRSVSVHDRHQLITLSTLDLQRFILLKIDKMRLETSEALRMASIPDGLPDELDSLLRDYHDVLVRRYSILTAKNHRRSSKYVVSAMRLPIKFCVYLAKSGLVTWGQVGNSELASFLEEIDSKLPHQLKRFVKYAQNKRNPFKKASSNKPRRGGGALIETPRPQIIHPDELKAFLDSLRRSLDDPRYLWAWLVCKLGLTVKRASELTLADIKINEQGRCVLRPYEAWILLPKQIESIVLELADALYPIWRSGTDTILAKLKLLSSVKETSRNFSTLYLQSKAVIIRASAIYAMMENGHLDRVTLKKTIGVSMPTLAKLERLFSVDVHRRLDPEFIKLRNVHITGQANHE
ncbi:Uncharacterised protein [Pseudomonas aeruginosa]|nr:Uncharacterised protein [Pseudomonas aeruginosa]